MNFITDIVQQALETGWLSLEAEERLRKMLDNSYSREDFEAFMKLQEAVIGGNVKQESRELISSKLS